MPRNYFPDVATPYPSLPPMVSETIDVDALYKQELTILEMEDKGLDVSCEFVLSVFYLSDGSAVASRTSKHILHNAARDMQAKIRLEYDIQNLLEAGVRREDIFAFFKEDKTNQSNYIGKQRIRIFASLPEYDCAPSTKKRKEKFDREKALRRAIDF